MRENYKGYQRGYYEFRLWLIWLHKKKIRSPPPRFRFRASEQVQNEKNSAFKVYGLGRRTFS